MFNKREPVSIAAAMKMIARLRQDFQDGQKMAKELSPRAVDDAPRRVTVDLSRDLPAKTSVFISGFSGSSSEVKAKLHEGGYAVAGAIMCGPSNSGKSQEVVLPSEEQALEFYRQIMSRRPNDTVSASKPAAKEEKTMPDHSAKVAAEMAQLRAVVSGLAKQFDQAIHSRGSDPHSKKAAFDTRVENKKKPCRMAVAGQPCAFWPNCKFAHPTVSETTTATKAAATAVRGVCHLFRDTGSCRSGAGCKFSHDGHKGKKGGCKREYR